MERNEIIYGSFQYYKHVIFIINSLCERICTWKKIFAYVLLPLQQWNMQQTLLKFTEADNKKNSLTLAVQLTLVHLGILWESSLSQPFHRLRCLYFYDNRKRKVVKISDKRTCWKLIPWKGGLWKGRNCVYL